MRSLLTRPVVLLFAVGAFAVGAFAQSNHGTITGTVSDPAGAVVPGAQIEIKNMETGVVYRGGASATGNYVISLPAGTYQISVTVPGFKKFVQQNVLVIPATDTRKDVKLEVGAATRRGYRRGYSALAQDRERGSEPSGRDRGCGSASRAHDSGREHVRRRRSMGQIRNPLQSMELLPGVNFSNDNAMVVNGLPSNSEAIRIEGQEATGNIWKSIQQLSQGASVDAIQEVNVQTSNFAAEYGQVGGGAINYTMKSGTNQFHGSAYDYFVNEALNAGLPFTDAGTQNPAKAGQHIRNAVRRNDYGFTVGGPIRHSQGVQRPRTRPSSSSISSSSGRTGQLPTAFKRCPRLPTGLAIFPHPVVLAYVAAIVPAYSAPRLLRRRAHRRWTRPARR